MHTLQVSLHCSVGVETRWQSRGRGASQSTRHCASSRGSSTHRQRGWVFSLIQAAAPSLTVFQQPWPSAPPQLKPNSFLPLFTSCSHCLGNSVLGFSLGRLPLPSVLSHPCIVPSQHLVQAGITAVTHFLLLSYCCFLLPECKLGKIIRRQSGLCRVFSISNPLFRSYQIIYSLFMKE